MILGIEFRTPFTSLLTISVPVASNCGRLVIVFLIRSPTMGAMVCSAELTAGGTAFMTFQTIGTTLLKSNVETLASSCSTDAVTSPPVESAARKLVSAACAAPKEPVSVVLASCAATPVSPRSCWMTWIAS